jgi:hypothetical protein
MDLDEVRFSLSFVMTGEEYDRWGALHNEKATRTRSDIISFYAYFHWIGTALAAVLMTFGVIFVLEDLLKHEVPGIFFVIAITAILFLIEAFRDIGQRLYARENPTPKLRKSRYLDVTIRISLTDNLIRSEMGDDDMRTPWFAFCPPKVLEDMIFLLHADEQTSLFIPKRACASPEEFAEIVAFMLPRAGVAMMKVPA